MRRVPIRLPDLVSMDDGPVFGQWLVDDGDAVLAGDRVAEIVTTGVLIYVASPAEGTVARGDVSPGTDLRDGTTLGTIFVSGGDSPDC